MAITHASGGTGTVVNQDISTTAASFPVASNRMFVLRLQEGQSHLTKTVTLGGQSPSQSYQYYSGSWWHAEGNIYVWDEATIASMSGTTLSVARSPANNNYMHYTLDYYDGVNQTIIATGGATDGTVDPSVTGVQSGDWLLSMAFGTYANITYAGTGTERLDADETVTNSAGWMNAADKVSTGTTVDDDYTYGDVNGGHAYIVIRPASGGGGGSSTAPLVMHHFLIQGIR